MDERGAALVLALMAVLLLAALGLALVATATTELMIASNYRSSQEGFYAADAAAERALAELPAVADWNALFDGSTRSTFADGLPSGVRTLADGSAIDLTQVVNTANCGKPSGCSAADLTANATGDRPWGVNNPVWRLYAYGRLADLAPAGTGDSIFYVVAMVGSGVDVLALRAEAFGPRGAHKVVELTVARAENRGVRTLSWRENR
jgi:Tfp pilus assembly protein PilX